MTRLKAMQVDDLVEFINKEITAIQLKAFDLGYKQGYAVGLDERQSNVEKEYYAYLEGRRYGYIKGFWEGKQHAELPSIESEYDAFREGRDYGYIKGVVTGIGQPDLENEYYAYHEGFADACKRDGRVKLYYNHESREFMSAADRRAYTDVDIPYGADSDIDMPDPDLRNENHG